MPHEGACLDTSSNYRPQRSWAKVMFLHASVCPQGGGSAQCMLGYHLPEADTPPKRQNSRRQTPPPEADPPEADTPPPRSSRSMSSRYASYWNAFLFQLIFTAHKRSLGQGNVFTDVCLSTGGRGSASRGSASVGEGVCIQGGRGSASKRGDVCIQRGWARGGGLHQGVGQTPLPQHGLRDTVNKRTVRILLECILVCH